MANKRKIEEEDDSLSLNDVIAESDELEETANAVLGGSDHQSCTYDPGYIKRQALFACNTCREKNNDQLAGMCLACSLECHDGHELFELYTKRQFRCDCGNSKFGGLKCKLVHSKDEINELNNYNHNFKGEYCTCNRPYPDLDDSIEDEMIQCITCEDWYHSRHLKLSKPVPEKYAEMICYLCMEKYDFLGYYHSDIKECLEVDITSIPSESSEKLEAKEHDTNNNTNELQNLEKLKKSNENEDTGNINETLTDSSNEPICKAKITSSEIKETTKCKLNVLKETYKGVFIKPISMFCDDKWRESICTCDLCIKMLKNLRLEYIVDKSDMTSEYEIRGQDSQVKTYNKGMEALREMDRLQQVEVINGYNNMKSELVDYLKTLGSGKVVTEADIKTFFEQLKKKKKPRMEMSYFCK